MDIQQEIKYCTYCDKQIRGRSDKKFCNDFCRSSYHYEINRTTSTLVHAINLSLRRNRKVIQMLLGSTNEPLEVERDTLLVYGFNFNYFTHMKHANCKTYMICYDFGYIPLSKEKVLIAHLKNIPLESQKPD